MPDSDIPDRESITENNLKKAQANPSDTTHKLAETSASPQEGSESDRNAAELSDGKSALSKIDLTLKMPSDMQVRITLDVLPARASDPGQAAEIFEELPDNFRYEIHPRQDSEQHFVFDVPPTQAPEIPIAKGRVRKSISARLQSWIDRWPYSFEGTLFGLALGLYLLTRLIGLSAFPIYFFSDEAVQTILAVDFLRENLHNAEGELLPTYFYNVDKYSLSTTVYLQIVPYLLFGKSVFVTRATSVLISLLAAICVGLILRDIFKLPYWWSGTLLLSITPAWFLHSRTAFETVTMVSFYTIGLYFYLRYRYGAPRLLYAALVFFALAFYSYNPGQIVVILTGVLLLISDARYHWEQRGVALRGAGLLLLLGLPYLRFYLSHPDSALDHLSTLGSYWLQEISWQEKFAHYRREYLYGLSPGYWFIPNQRDLIRHVMKGYGNLLRASLPFAVVGLFQALRSFRSSAHRALLITFLAAPAGAAIVQVAVTRALVMVVPVTLFTALGLGLLLTWIEKRIPRRVLTLALFILLAGINIFIAWDALWNGDTWYSNYGLSGLQYGAAQIYSAADDFLKENNDDQLLVSPSWANGADIVARFFLDDPLPVVMSSIQGHLNHRQPLDDRMVFLMPEDEYRMVVDSGKFADIQIERIVPYPDGRPGFYFVRLSYAEDVDNILQAEQAQRRTLLQAEVEIDGQSTLVRHSLLDLGRIVDLWDGNPRTVTRTFEANPYIIEIKFNAPNDLSAIELVVGDTEVEVLARVYTTGSSEPLLFQEKLQGSVDDQLVAVEFNQVLSVETLYLEVTDLHQEEPGHVHIWEIYFR